MSYDPEDVGGDPACWLHLFEDEFEGADASDEPEGERTDEAAGPEPGAGTPG